MKEFATKRITAGMLFVIMVLSIFFSTGAFAANVEINDGATAEEMGVEYRGHVQNVGDMPTGKDNFIPGPDPIGTRGRGLRVEGFMIKLTGDVPAGAKIVYQVHVENEGWMTAVEDGAFAGTREKSQRVESIKITLKDLPGYDVYYRGHVQNVGNIPQVAGEWGWVKNGEEMGTTGSGLRLEELQVKIVKHPDVNYDKAGTYGPVTGVKVVENNVIINSPNVTLRNLHIKGNLTIGEGVGKGDVTLNNVTVDGDTFVRGGGENSIHINGGQYNQIIVQETSSGKVRIVAVGADGLEVVISEDAKGEEIILEGAFDSVKIEAPDVKVSTQGDTKIGEFTLADGATGSQITLDAKTTVDKLVLDEKADVKGQGTVKEADVNKSGVTFEKAPDKQDVGAGVTPPVVTPPAVPPVVPPTPTPGGGGGGGGDTTAPTLSGVTAGPVVIGANIAATSNEAGYLYLVPAATAANKTAIEAAGIVANGRKVAATANVSANLSTTSFAAGSYKVYAIDGSGNVSSGSSAISVTAVIEWATSPIATIAKSGDNPPYQLMQINYKRNAVVTSSVMTIKMKTPASGDVAVDTVLWKSSGGTTQNASAYWQWSYRNANSVFVNGSLDTTTQANLDSVERTNTTQLKEGSVVAIQIDVVKDGVTTTISRDYTITADDVTNSTYFAASEASDLSSYTAALAAVVEADYTAKSWETYQGVVNGNVMTGANTPADITAATSSITSAQSALIKKTDVSYLSKAGDLNAQNGYEASFSWGSIIGAGSENVKTAGSPGGYNYYTDGVFLRFNVKTESNEKKTFNEVFGIHPDGSNTMNNTADYSVGAMVLQTGTGSINDMDGSDREKADWGVSGLDSFKTALQGEKALFYGVIQNTTDGTKTVGFNQNEDRTVKMKFNPQASAVAGSYTINVEVVQQGTWEVLDVIEYDITLPSAPVFGVKSIEKNIDSDNNFVPNDDQTTVNVDNGTKMVTVGGTIPYQADSILGHDVGSNLYELKISLENFNSETAAFKAVGSKTNTYAASDSWMDNKTDGYFYFVGKADKSQNIILTIDNDGSWDTITDAVTYTVKIDEGAILEESPVAKLTNSISGAINYAYEPAYEYKGTPTYANGAVTITYASVDAMGTGKVEVMNDMARYLGALNRLDNGASIKKIVFNNEDFTWNNVLTQDDEITPIKGSCWILASQNTGNSLSTKNVNSLISKIVTYFSNYPSITEITITVMDENNKSVSFPIKAALQQ